MEKENKKFRDFMNSLSIEEHKRTVDRIAEECCVGRRRVYYWKGGSPVSKIHKKIICNVIGQQVFD